MLYLVPTPIGNLRDMTYRAVEVLQAVSLIYAEDTRTSGHLLKHYNIDTPMRSYHNFNEHKIAESIVKELQSGVEIALISDAGTPSISDPGFLLVRACVQAGVKVTCLPGATAFAPAIAMSGLSSDKFYYEGFLPHKKGRQTRWKYLATVESTFICYESPFRVVKFLEEALEHLGPDRKICTVREISKIYEDAKGGTIAEVLAHFSEHNPKGEFVIVVEGNKKA